jgi:ABC-type thiamin/hydroxymethylpyrimidine transport system permease subunit
MKPSLTILVLVLLLLNIVAGCAPGPNQSNGMATDHDVAGFWLGLWQGFIAPFVFVVSLFKATSISTRSTTTELGTTLAICSA